MGEQTLSNTFQSLTYTLPSSSSATSSSAPTAASPSSDLSVSEPPSSSTTITTTVAAKIPFRPQKIRKVSPSTPAAALDEKNPVADAATAAISRMVVRVIPRPLSAEGEIAAALRHLRAVDPHLVHVIDAHAPPSFHCLLPPFHALARSILYQQLAYKAAASIYGRFLSLCGGEAGVVPEQVLALNPQQLRQIGVSARKASYLHDLARKYHTGILSDAAIVSMDDKSLFSMLTMVKGIGAWSVHMFMIFSLHRPDVLPVGDLGVRKGVRMLYGLEEVPRPSQMEQLCERWKPYRSVGSWYMWRLNETKSNPSVPSSSAGGGGLAITSIGGGIGGLRAVQQPQLFDPIQMLPNLG